MIAATLYKELKAYGKSISEKEWNLMQIDYLKSHRYFTKTAQEMRNRGKQKQLEKLIAATTSVTVPK
jgi:hypothetical protein